MDMLRGEQIAEARLTDWRKLAQGLHARYLVDDFLAGARFLAAVGEAGDALGHHPKASIGTGHVDLKLSSVDAIYRDNEGTEHVVEWVTQQDVDLARRITEIAADTGSRPTPRGQRHRARPRHGALRDHRAGVGRAADRACRRTGSRYPQRRDPGRDGSGAEPVVRGCRRAGDARGSVSTSRSMSRPRWPSSGSPPLWPLVGRSSTTATRPRSPSSPTRTATPESSASTRPLRRSSERPVPARGSTAGVTMPARRSGPDERSGMLEPWRCTGWTSSGARELRSAPLTYTPQVAHEDWLRAGYRHLTVSTTLTRRDFDGAVRDLFAWCVQSGAGLEVHASDVPLRQGTVVLMSWGVGALSLKIPCRVLDVVHEERRQGFSYGTLPGHPEAGEERFLLERLEDGAHPAHHHRVLAAGVSTRAAGWPGESGSPEADDPPLPPDAGPTAAGTRGALSRVRRCCRRARRRT